MDTKKLLIAVLIVLAAVGIGYLIAQIVNQPQLQKHEVVFSVIVFPPGDFSIDISPKNEKGDSEVSIYRGEKGIFTVKATPTGGFDVPIQLEVVGLPASAVSFSKNPMGNNDEITMTVDSSYLESNKTYVCTLVARAYKE